MKEKGSSFYKQLIELYKEFGFYKEELISLVKKGIEGESEIKQMMVDLRENPLQEINGEKVVLIEDYQSSISKNIQDHSESVIDLPKSNVLIYYTEEGSKIAARPSGTEPKIKFYISVNEEFNSSSDFEETQYLLQHKIAGIRKDLQVV